MRRTELRTMRLTLQGSGVTTDMTLLAAGTGRDMYDNQFTLQPGGTWREEQTRLVWTPVVQHIGVPDVAVPAWIHRL